MKAGAHVYVEKPTGHTINESRAMVKVAQETGVVVQVGLHRRIGPFRLPQGAERCRRGRRPLDPADARRAAGRDGRGDP